MCAQTNDEDSSAWWRSFQSKRFNSKRPHEEKYEQLNFQSWRCPEFQCGGWGYHPRLISGSRALECAVNGACAWDWINHVFVCGRARLLISSQTEPQLCKFLPVSHTAASESTTKDACVVGSTMATWRQTPGLSTGLLLVASAGRGSMTQVPAVLQYIRT